MEFDSSTFRGWLRLGHVVPGFLGLVVFWLPSVIRSQGLKAFVGFELAVTLFLATFSFYNAAGGRTLWWLLFGLSIGGFLGWRKHLYDVSRPLQFKMQWWYRHMEYMLVTGIASHTAFFVLGGARIIGDIFIGSLSLVPWLAPTIIGVPRDADLGRILQAKRQRQSIQ